MSTTLFAISPSIYETLLLSFALFMLAKKLRWEARWKAWIPGLRMYCLGASLKQYKDGMICGILDIAYVLMLITNLPVMDSKLLKMVFLLELILFISVLIYSSAVIRKETGVGSLSPAPKDGRIRKKRLRNQKMINNTEKLKDHIENCGITGAKVLKQEANGEQYRHELLQLLEMMKTITRDEIIEAAYPSNIESTILMDQYLIDGTITEEFDQLSLLSTLVTYVACNSEGRRGHSAEYMDRVTDLRKVIEEVYGTEAIRFCGSDGC